MQFLTPDIKNYSVNEGLVLITENSIGDKYMLTVSNPKEILDDWNGECENIPSNDAQIHFAMLNGEVLNLPGFTSFEYLIGYIQGYCSRKLL